nr:hypothetical protein [Streptomyces tailanensis]
MFRGATARTVVSVLAAVLLALQLFTPSTAFAFAHTARHIEAKAQSGIQPSGKAPRTGTKLSAKASRDEIVNCRDTGRHGGPTGPRCTRDRLRTAVCAPEAPERQLRHDPSAAHDSAGPGAAHHRTSRSSTAHSPAALQVFRC